MEEIERDKNTKNMKNMKEIVYTNIGSYKSGEQAEQKKIENPRMIMKYQEIKKKMKKLLSPRK